MPASDAQAATSATTAALDRLLARMILRATDDPVALAGIAALISSGDGAGGDLGSDADNRGDGEPPAADNVLDAALASAATLFARSIRAGLVEATGGDGRAGGFGAAAAGRPHTLPRAESHHGRLVGGGGSGVGYHRPASMAGGWAPSPSSPLGDWHAAAPSLSALPPWTHRRAAGGWPTTPSTGAAFGAPLPSAWAGGGGGRSSFNGWSGGAVGGCGDGRGVAQTPPPSASAPPSGRLSLASDASGWTGGRDGGPAAVGGAEAAAPPARVRAPSHSRSVRTSQTATSGRAGDGRAAARRSVRHALERLLHRNARRQAPCGSRRGGGGGAPPPPLPRTAAGGSGGGGSGGSGWAACGGCGGMPPPLPATYGSAWAAGDGGGGATEPWTAALLERQLRAEGSQRMVAEAAAEAVETASWATGMGGRGRM